MNGRVRCVIVNVRNVVLVVVVIALIGAVIVMEGIVLAVVTTVEVVVVEIDLAVMIIIGDHHLCKTHALLPRCRAMRIMSPLKYGIRGIENVTKRVVAVDSARKAADALAGMMEIGGMIDLEEEVVEGMVITVAAVAGMATTTEERCPCQLDRDGSKRLNNAQKIHSLHSTRVMLRTFLHQRLVLRKLFCLLLRFP